MKRVWILASAFLCISAASFAEPPSQPPLTREALAAILGEPAVTSSCPTPPARVLLAAQRPRTGLDKSLCMATANCFPGTVTCSGNNSTTSCSAADRNCPTEQGHVTCDGHTTFCSTACTCTGTPLQIRCCQCDQTDDCVSCCICGGGHVVQCNVSCSGG